MKYFFRLAAVASALTVSAATHATNYNFSYTFSDQKVVSGSFSGDVNGNLIDNISNTVFNYDGNRLIFDGSEDAYGHQHNAPTLSIDGTANDFEFFKYNNSTDFYSNGNSIYAARENYLNSSHDNIQNSSWHVTAAGVTPPVTAVPEPETYALLLGGLSVLGFLARRRESL